MNEKVFCQSYDISTGTSSDKTTTITELEAENAALKAEIEMGKKREDAMHERWKKATAKYPNGAEGCCCLFDKDGNQINWCSVHAELRDELYRIKTSVKKKFPSHARCENCKHWNGERYCLTGPYGICPEWEGMDQEAEDADDQRA